MCIHNGHTSQAWEFYKEGGQLECYSAHQLFSLRIFLASLDLHVNAADCPPIRPQLCPPKSFPFHHSPVIVLFDTDGSVKLKINTPKLTTCKECGCLRELFLRSGKSWYLGWYYGANHSVYFLAFNNISLLHINLVCFEIFNNCVACKDFTRLC